MSTLPAFDLHRPETVEEALELLERHGDDAALVCGGTELVLLLKLGLAEYGHLVDLKRIAELRTLRADDGTLRIGAAVTHRELETSPEVAARWPALAAMERTVANVRVRGAGTVGGNLAFSDPHSDPATFLLAAEAEVVVRGRRGERALALADFLRGPYETALEDGELLAAVHVPAPPAGAALTHAKLAFRERPAATVTCLARLDGGVVAEARVAVGSVGGVAVRAARAERSLVGLDAAAPDTGALEAAGAAAAEEAGAVADANGSVEYKQALVQTLVRRAFGRALADASGAHR